MPQVDVCQSVASTSRSFRVSIYVRRPSADLAHVEIELAAHDRPVQGDLDLLDLEADRYPLGPKDYWR